MGAQGIDFTAIQHAQNFSLREKAHIPDFVEEERAFVSEFQFAAHRRRSAGEGAFPVTE